MVWPKKQKKNHFFSMLKKGFFCFLIEAPLHLRVFVTFTFWHPQEVTIPNKRYLPKETPSHCHLCCPHLHPCNRELQQPYCSSIRKAWGISRIFYSHFPFLKRRTITYIKKKVTNRGKFKSLAKLGILRKAPSGAPPC